MDDEALEPPPQCPIEGGMPCRGSPVGVTLRLSPPINETAPVDTGTDPFNGDIPPSVSGLARAAVREGPAPDANTDEGDGPAPAGDTEPKTSGPVANADVGVVVNDPEPVARFELEGKPDPNPRGPGLGPGKA